MISGLTSNYVPFSGSRNGDRSHTNGLHLNGLHLNGMHFNGNGNGHNGHSSPLDLINEILEGCAISPSLRDLAARHKHQSMSPLNSDLHISDREMGKVVIGHAGGLARGFLEYRDLLNPAKKSSFDRIPLEVLHLRACEGDLDGRWLTREFGVSVPDYQLFAGKVRERLVEQVLAVSMWMNSDRFLSALQRYSPFVMNLMACLSDLDVSSELKSIFRPEFNGRFCRGIPGMEDMGPAHTDHAMERVARLFEARHSRIVTHRFISYADFTLDTYYMDPRFLVRSTDELYGAIRSYEEPHCTWQTVRNVIGGMIAHRLAPFDPERQADILETIERGRRSILWSKVKTAAVVASSLRLLYFIP